MRSAVLIGIIATIVAIGAGLAIYYGFKPSDDKETSPSLSPTKSPTPSLPPKNSPTAKKWTVIGDLSEFDEVVMAKNGETVLGYKGDSHQFLDWQSNEWVKRGQAVGGFQDDANILDDGSAAIILLQDPEYYCHFTANNCNSFDYSNYSNYSNYENGFYEESGQKIAFFNDRGSLTGFFEDKYFKFIDGKLRTFSLNNHTLTVFNPETFNIFEGIIFAMSLNPMKIAWTFVTYKDEILRNTDIYNTYLNHYSNDTQTCFMNLQFLNGNQWVDEKKLIVITNHTQGMDKKTEIDETSFAFSKDGRRLAHWSSLLENDYRVKVLDENYDQLGSDILKEGFAPISIELSDDGAVLVVVWEKTLSQQRQVQRYTWTGTSWQPGDSIDLFVDGGIYTTLSSDGSRLLVDSHSYTVPAKVYELM